MPILGPAGSRKDDDEAVLRSVLGPPKRRMAPLQQQARAYRRRVHLAQLKRALMVVVTLGLIAGSTLWAGQSGAPLTKEPSYARLM